MKILSAIGLATVLAVSASAANAERHGKNHHKQGWSSVHKKVERTVKRDRYYAGEPRRHNESRHSGRNGHHSKKVIVTHNYYSGHRNKHRAHHGAASHNRYYLGHRYGKRYNYPAYRPYYFRHHSRHHSSYYRNDRVFPALVGAAIVGSVIRHSLYHTHNGVVCYDNHADSRHSGYDNSYDPGVQDTGYSEVSGCHRIERMPDGSERRVEVPISQCY